MVTRIDHNGKSLQRPGAEHRVASIIQTETQRLRGVVFHDLDVRLKDYLNDQAEGFIAVSEVEFLAADGTVTERCEFLAVNKRNVQWVMPIEEPASSPV